MSFEDCYVGIHPVLVAALTLVSGDREVARDAADEALVRALELWSRVGVVRSPEAARAALVSLLGPDSMEVS